MAQGRRIYHLKLSLIGARLPVWRRIAISANVTLQQAHGVIQKAMAWRGIHRYCFSQDGREFGQLPPDGAFYVEDDSSFSLRYCLCLPGHELMYAYGPWRLSIVMESMEKAEGRHPWRLVDGAGDSPPDALDGAARVADRALAPSGSIH
jgi:hypothetical protein